MYVEIYPKRESQSAALYIFSIYDYSEKAPGARKMSDEES